MSAVIQREWLLWVLGAVSLLPILRVIVTIMDTVVVAYADPWDLALQLALVLLYVLAFAVTVVSHIVLLRRYKALKRTHA